jgi:type I restriction enzyme S subunit
MTSQAAWDEVELGDVVTLHRGYDLPSSQRRSGTVPIVSSSGTTGYHDEAKILPPGVVTGRYGTLGEVFFVEEPFWPLNTTLYVSDFHGNDERFVSYFLECQHIGTQGVAAAVPGVNRNVLHRLPVRRPPLPAQRKIAAILSTYDDLIKNNNRRSKILEEIAQRIYREWFVDFRYPGHESIPLVDSRLGRIPKGWTLQPLEAICSLMQAGGTPARGKPEYWKNATINWFTTRELQDGFLLASLEQIAPLAVTDKKTRMFPSGAILMAIYGASIGRLGVLTEEATCNQAALAMTGKEIPQTILYYMLLDLREHFKSIAQGAAQQNISKQKVAETIVLRPPIEVCQAADEIIVPMWEQRVNLERATLNARATRDLLLPRLISGEIDVAGLDIAMPEAAV